MQVRLETIVGPLFEDDTGITSVEQLGEAIGGSETLPIRGCLELTHASGRGA